MHVLRNNGQRIVTGEGKPAGCQFVKQNAKRVEIGASVDWLAQCLFWRHVSSRADNQTDARDTGAVGRQCETKIGKLHVARLARS